jgi:hypothetical protein
MTKVSVAVNTLNTVTDRPGGGERLRGTEPGAAASRLEPRVPEILTLPGLAPPQRIG